MTMQGGHGLAATDVLVEALRKAGVSNESHVVIYGDALSAGWLFFVLDHLGHTRMSLLDGGLVKWRSEDRPIARTPVAPPAGTFTAAAAAAAAGDGRRRAGAARRRRRRAARRAQLEGYEAGRIPGAKLLTWTDVFADPRRQVFKSQKELAELFAAAGAAPGSRARHLLPDWASLERALLCGPLAGLDVAQLRRVVERLDGARAAGRSR